MDARKSYVFQSKDVRASKRRRLVTEDDLSTSLGLRKEQYEKQWNKVEQNINVRKRSSKKLRQCLTIAERT